MRVIMLMFDSLNRHMLPPYNAETWVQAPNFRRLAQRSVTFDRSYVCSMPCMPARRDLHTGRPNFLHCHWGPLEPFDDSVPEMLKRSGVHTHLASDHYHYFEDGGATYHTRYSTWEFFRGQEGDPWIGQVAPPQVPDHINGKSQVQDWINRPHIARDADHCQTRTVAAGLEHIDRNHDQDNWMLQIECFDPHEPFFCDRQWKDRYPSDYDGPLLDWPGYCAVKETPEQVEEAKRNYAALVSKCDAGLGDVLDAMDRHGMWDDTMLVVWTDHGYMLGEHGCWAKNWMPLYEEIAHTPMFIWDPRHPDTAGQRRSALVQPAIDLGPTLLRCFGQEPTPDMLGQDLAPVIERDQPVRDAAIFGYHGNRVNITDGRYIYYRQSVTENNGPNYQYTLMPTSMHGFKLGPGTVPELAGPFTFTKGLPVLRFGDGDVGPLKPDADHLLFDLEQDPQQEHPLDDPQLEQRLCEQMVALMQACDAPPEQFVRMGLEAFAAAKS